jgi:hypothetical protein
MHTNIVPFRAPVKSFFCVPSRTHEVISSFPWALGISRIFLPLTN